MSEQSKTYPVPDGPPDTWTTREVAHTTRCKHGWGDCALCGTSDRRDAIHTARTPDKRTARRQRRKGKR